MYYIVTVYDSLNYGSFFQAQALKRELEKYGDVRYINVHHQNILKQTLIICLKNFLKCQFKSSHIEYENYNKFKISQQSFNTISIEEIKTYKKNDIIFFGSDEIWNIGREKMRGTKEFFGINISCDNKASLAVSVNDSSIDDFLNHRDLVKSITDFSFLSVRDYHSKNVINQVTNRKASMVGDPTLMHNKKIYSEMEKNVNYNNYILVYSYGRMLNSNLIIKLKEVAESTGLKLLSVGRYFDFCDINAPADPYEFLGYVDNADYVFTDTFHGLMFSLIFEKQFIIFPCGNTKVESTLDYLNIKERLYSPIKGIYYYLDNTLDYNDLTPRINEYGNTTKLFIKNVMRSVNNDN